MSPAQIKKYRFVWGRVRRQLRDAGVTPAAADARRHQIHGKALGRDKSSLDFTNADFDRVLAHFIAVLEPDNLEAQLRLIEQPIERRARAEALCRAILDQMPQFRQVAGPDFYKTNYLDALARKVRGEAFADLDEAGLFVIHGILQARFNPEPKENENPF